MLYYTSAAEVQKSSIGVAQLILYCASPAEVQSSMGFAQLIL